MAYPRRLKKPAARKARPKTPASRTVVSKRASRTKTPASRTIYRESPLKKRALANAAKRKREREAKFARQAATKGLDSAKKAELKALFASFGQPPPTAAGRATASKKRSAKSAATELSRKRKSAAELRRKRAAQRRRTAQRRRIT